jgi:hypothetical protein
MDGHVSPERLARLWDRYVEVSRRYHLAKQASDTAEARYASAYEQVEAAHAEEVIWAHTVTMASAEFTAASDAAFLLVNGISAVEPSSVAGKV